MFQIQKSRETQTKNLLTHGLVGTKLDCSVGNHAAPTPRYRKTSMKPNTLIHADCLPVLKGMDSESVDLIYLDPPFNSNADYKSAAGEFSDKWTLAEVDSEWLTQCVITRPSFGAYISAIGDMHSKAMMAYVAFMTQRLMQMHRVLKSTGSIYLHVDPTASHYLKVVMDRIFGKDNYRNEIVWCYHGPGSPGMRQFNRKSDTIFWYNKGDTWTFNKDAVRLPYKDGGPHAGGFKGTDVKPTDPKYSKAGKVPENWWTIAIAARSKKEYVGYPTQKPLALLHRIIKASSNEGDVVLDPFCGCATACVAAQQLGRKWIGIDISEKAIKAAQSRMLKGGDLTEL